MPATKRTRTKARRNAAEVSTVNVACWEDDPGDPRTQPASVPIHVAVPNQAGQPLAFGIAGNAPAPQIYQPGTRDFLYYAAACALRRTADFWGPIIRPTVSWRIGKSLPVELDSGLDLNAFYTRGGFGDTPGLHFFHDTVLGRLYFSAESPDVVCHEMGHAILDAIKPRLWNAQSIEAAAFHESFGDMSALLSALQVASFRQAVLTDTGGVVNRASRLSRLAEQLGAAIRARHPDAVEADCLRNAVNSFFYRDPQTLPPSAPAIHLSSEPHSFSRVFTGAFLDVLAGIFKQQPRSPSAEGLAKASADAARILVDGVRAAAVVADFYSQVAAHMIHVGEGAPFNGKYRDALKSAFVRRGILSPQSGVTVADMPRVARRRTAAAMTAAQDRELPRVAISAGQYGLSKSTLNVFAAQDPRRLAVTASSSLPGSTEPRSSQNAAESYTEDLFQRGHVDTGTHVRGQVGLVHPFSFKTHVIVDEQGELVLRRRTFDCGFAQRWIG